MNNVRGLLSDKNVDISFAVQGTFVSRVDRSNISLKLLKYLPIVILLIAAVNNIILFALSQKALCEIVTDIAVIVLLFLLLMYMKLSQGDTIIIDDEELIEANWLHVKRIKWSEIKYVTLYGSYEDNRNKVFMNLPRTLIKVAGSGCVIGINNRYSNISVLRKIIISRTDSKIINREVDLESLILFVLALAMGILVAIFAQGWK